MKNLLKSKLSRVIATATATFAMLAVGLVAPSAANAAALSNNALYQSNSYTSKFTLGTGISLPGNPRSEGFSTYYYAKDLASHQGQTLTFTANVSGNGTFSPSYDATVTFYTSTDMTWQSMISQQSGGWFYPTNSTYMTPNSVVIPANAVAMSMNAETFFNNYNGTGNLSNQTISVDYAVKYDGTAQSATAVDTASNVPSTGLVYATATNLVRLNGIAGTYSTDANTTTEDSDLFTCVNVSDVTSSTVLTAQGKIGGSSQSGMSYQYANLDTFATQGSSAWLSGYDATADLSTQGRSSLLTGSQILIAATGHLSSGIPTGSRAWDLSVTNGSSTELTTPCVIAAPTTAPTATLSGSAISITPPVGIANNTNWGYQIYRATDTAMANLLYSNTNYYFSSNPSPNASVTASMGGLPTGVPLVVRYVNSTTLGYTKVNSNPGPASTSVTIPVNAMTLTSTVSNGDDPGQAKSLASAGSYIDYSAAMAASGNGPSQTMVSDGNQGFFTAKFSQGNTTLYHITSDGIDATFAGTGPSQSIATMPQSMSDPLPANAAVGWYGARDKWVTAVVYQASSGMSTQLSDFHDSMVLKTGSIGSATVTTTTLTETALNTFCAAQQAGSRFAGSSYEVISSPMANPLIKLNCDLTFDRQMYSFTSATILASVTTGASPVITAVYKFNSGSGAEVFGGFPRATGMGGGAAFTGTNYVSAYPLAAAATDTAVAFYAVTAGATGTTPTITGTVASVKLVRVKMNGTSVATDNPITIATSMLSTQANQTSVSNGISMATSQVGSQLPVLPALSGGTALLGLRKVTTVVNQSPVYTWKLQSLNASTGVFDDGADINIDTDATYPGASSLSWVGGGQVVTGTGKALLQRYSYTIANNVSSYVRGQAVLDLSSRNLDSGEAITYTQPMSSGIFSLFFVDPQGRMNMLGTMDANKFGWIRWNSTQSGASLPAGVTIGGQSSLFVTASGGGKVTLTGTGLGTISAVTVGGNRALGFTKSATSLVVDLPKNLSGAQAITATFPAPAGNVDIASITYLSGATKQAQTITDTNDVNATWSGVLSKTTQAFPATTSVGLPTTVKVDKAAVCSVTGQTVTMNAAGTCVVTVSSAGDLGTTASSVTTNIVVTKRAQNVDTILAAVTAAASTWAGTQQTVALPGALTSVGLAATITVSPAAVCTYAAAVVTIKSSGTCAVAVVGAADAGTDAIAKVTRNIVIAKGDLNLTAESTLSLSNNPADDSNTEDVNSTVASGAANLVDYTYTSDNEDICTVDDSGVVTGVAVGTCHVTTAADAGSDWVADTATTTVTVQDSTTQIPDALPEVGDGNALPKAVANNKNAFAATNDSSLQVKWDKANGLLTLQSKGVYIGFIKAEVTFTKNATTYTCTNVFGTTAALASKTAAQKKAALKTKVFAAAAASCKDTSGISVPDSINAVTDFAKIKKVAKVAGNVTTAGTTKYEAAAQAALKGFAGNMTIKITRYRAWPTTMKNLTPGTGSNAKKIPATIRTTVINLL